MWILLDCCLDLVIVGYKFNNNSIGNATKMLLGSGPWKPSKLPKCYAIKLIQNLFKFALIYLMGFLKSIWIIFLCSAVDHFKKQFAYLEEHYGKGGTVTPPERQHASLPRCIFRKYFNYAAIPSFHHFSCSLVFFFFFFWDACYLYFSLV